MKPYRIYDVRKEKLFLPFVFLPKWEREYEEFLSEYDPETGFLMTKTKTRNRQKNEEQEVYFLYLGAKHYRLDFFQQRYRDVAFAIRSCDGISQKNTITIAAEAIRIIGIPKDFFFMSSDWQSFWENHKGSDLFPTYVPNFSTETIKTTSEDPAELIASAQKMSHFLENSPFFGGSSMATAPSVFFRSRALVDVFLEEKKSRKEIEVEPDPLWQFLLETSEKKKEFESNFLIEWQYLSFDRKGKVDDAHLCEFTIAAPDQTIRQNEARFEAFRKEIGIAKEDSDSSIETLRESYLNKLGSGTMIEIPLNRAPDKSGKQPMLFGSVVRFEFPGITAAEGEEVKLPEDYFEKNEHFSIPWKMIVSFKDDSDATLKEISASGTLCERVSTDYQNYKSALGVMVNRIADLSWKSAEDIIIRQNLSPFEVKPEEDFVSKRLNPNQKEAISLALSAPDFCLIQGPPGSGKTTIITEMVRKFVNRGERVLVCSKGNLAVDNVLEKWIEENKMRPDSHLCVRLGQNFKLPFLKDYTPAKVTERVQEKAYNKTREERDQLSQKVEDKIRFLEENREKIEAFSEFCTFVFDLTETLLLLLQSYQNAPSYLNWMSSVLSEKTSLASSAYSIVYNQVFLPVCRALFSSEVPSEKTVKEFDEGLDRVFQIAQTLKAPAEYDFIARLFAKNWIALWNQNEAALLSKIGIVLAKNEKETEWKSISNPALLLLSLPDFGKTPDPFAVLRFARTLPEEISRFSDREILKIERIRTVLNDWLQELGSGVSTPLERTVVLDSIPVIGSTCMGIMSDNDFKGVKYDVVIVDEAGQIPIFDLMVPLIKAKKVVLIGDHLQLPPMNEDEFLDYLDKTEYLETEEGEKKEILRKIGEWYNVSLFEKLYRTASLNPAKKMLDTQYRMHPDICQFISKSFYNGEYKAHDSTKNRILRIAGFDQPIYFYDTCTLPEKARAETYHNPGYSNTVEAEKISDILVKILLAIREGNYEGENLVLRDKATDEIIGYDIGVISGYKKQVKAISNLTQKKLEAYMSPEEADLHMSRFMISSVDSFQGRDNQIILFSMTRSNPEGKIGFLKDVRRLNVAMTRAKSLLIMVGDSATLTACPASCAHDASQKVADLYRALILHCNQKHYYHPMKGEESDGQT